MKLPSRLVPVCAVVSVLASIGCTTRAPVGEGTPQPATQAAAREVPRLKVVMDCGLCQVKPETAEWVVQGYADEAAYAGAKIVPEQEATLTIKEYSSRSDTARMLLGMFSGKDEMKAMLTFGGKRFLLEEYFANAVSGSETLARKMGRMALQQIAQ